MSEPNEILISLYNLNEIKNDYHRELIKTVLQLNKWDRIFYTYRPKQMSKFKFIEYHGVYKGQSEIVIQHNNLTYQTIMNLYYEHKRESEIDNFAKKMLENNVALKIQKELEDKARYAKYKETGVF